MDICQANGSVRVRSGDTIAAISTPLGEGGIGIVRMTGSEALDILGKVFRRPNGKPVPPGTHRVYYGHIVDPEEGEIVDEVLVTVMRGPCSYTREDVVEIGCHGGTASVVGVLNMVMKAGARLAEPGEFTKRAFLNGRIDLAQAEAILDVIRARSRAASSMALKQLEGKLSRRIGKIREVLFGLLTEIEASIDFPDDVEDPGYEALVAGIRNCLADVNALLETWETGRIYKEGLKVGIVGKPNVGKSSLLNALLGEPRAIVTDVPGTTRDLIEETMNLRGIPVRLIDTAGIRDTDERVEKIGVELAREVSLTSDIVLFVVDASTGLGPDDLKFLETLPEGKTVIVVNKVDLPHRLAEEDLKRLGASKDGAGRPIVRISATKGIGIDELEDSIAAMVMGRRVVASEECILTNIRHREALAAAQRGLGDALRGAEECVPVDLIAIDLREAASSLGQITGDEVTSVVIEEIFSRFCVGK